MALHWEERCRWDDGGTNTVQGCKVTIAGLPPIVLPSHGGCAAPRVDDHASDSRRAARWAAPHWSGEGEGPCKA